MKLLLALCVAVLCGSVPVAAEQSADPVTPVKMVFPSAGALRVTADLYVTEKEPKTAPFILLYHQAGWSRGEYREIASRLVKLGFNCLAVDLRSGDEVHGVPNETAARAKELEKPSRYIDTLPDISSALKMVRDRFSPRIVLLWGSSYSASLVLYVAEQVGEQVDGVLAFSPGEYFEKEGQASDWIQSTAANVQVPVFITSAASEKEQWWPIYQALPDGNRHYFLPTTEGNHGARALWKEFPDSESYWKAVEDFLRPFLQADGENKQQ